MKELTEEVLKARAESKARREFVDTLAAERVADEEEEKREIVERAKKEYPEKYAEFNQLKTLLADWNAKGIENRLCRLQAELVYPDWIWHGIPDIDNYTSKEMQIIDEVASGYYEKVEKRLRAGEDVDVDEDELISLIEEAGIDTCESADGISFTTNQGLHHSTILSTLINGDLAYIDDDEIPDELKY